MEPTAKANDIIKTIEQFIISNQENTKNIDYNENKNNYATGYTQGYHDALVDILNKLKVNHSFELYND